MGNSPFVRASSDSVRALGLMIAAQAIAQHGEHDTSRCGRRSSTEAAFSCCGSFVDMKKMLLLR
jgi:hypothetical protein